MSVDLEELIINLLGKKIKIVESDKIEKKGNEDMKKKFKVAKEG